ncbi:OmpA family protein [Paraburkholderia acidisoli]|uniref:OmpA-like domain-containing protein n=1 Tax=Paraburkholderia acidisoli TaxID=2571748 RepID=A0A7Z2JEY4_9BURK|nr:hypothetical protein [Paraburkholderia acidisoli]QGZ62211.1 hypothetical protein FAZ98_10990 [Paraburkholderia acidisoli]
MKRIVLFLSLALALPCAFACAGSPPIPGVTRDINFAFNSSEMSNAEILSLANWIVDTHSKRSVLEGVSITGLADKREHNPQLIAEERANIVKRTLDVLGVRAAKFEVVGHLYRAAVPNDKFEPTGTRAELTLIPECPE